MPSKKKPAAKKVVRRRNDVVEDTPWDTSNDGGLLGVSQQIKRRSIPWAEHEEEIDRLRKLLTKEPTIYDKRSERLQSLESTEQHIKEVEQQLNRLKDYRAQLIKDIKDLNSQIELEIKETERNQ